MMGGRRFSSFIVFAEMRTGSNFLEQNINQFADLHCYGELFNGDFIGKSKQQEVLGISRAMRDQDPLALVEKIKVHDANVLPGFRFFNDHDPRVLRHCLPDHSCAKIILNRNPIDSYVSQKIADKTGQWLLTDLKDKKSARIRFSEKEFTAYLERIQAFQLKLLNGLQKSGQGAFYINYDDINTLSVLNGLAAYLGSTSTATALKTNLKRQNPASLESKVINFDEMSVALDKIDLLNLSRTPNFEPRRGAGVPGYVAANTAKILFTPLKAAANSRVLAWMAAQDNVDEDQLVTGFNQKTLRQWRKGNPGYHSLTVVRHPVARAHVAFCCHILSTGPQSYGDIRNKLIRDYGLNLPKDSHDRKDYDAATHRQAFQDFLTFLKGNLQEQTRIRIDPAWASQQALLHGVADIAPPHHIIREDDLPRTLIHIEDLLGLKHQPLIKAVPIETPFDLADIYDQEIEAQVRDIYMRDYLYFGFGDWR